MKSNRWFIVAALFTLAVPLIAASTPGFSPVGVVPDQTARINAVMGAEPHLSQRCGGVIQLRFLDSNGNVLAQKTARFSPTAVESLEFTPLRETARTQVLADISWVTAPSASCRGAVFGNVEVYNNATGQTQFVLPGAIQGFQDVDN